MGHNVGKAAERAVQRSERVKATELPPEQLIQALRNNLAANLYVPNHQIAVLLGGFDAEREFSHKLAEENIKLKNLNASQSIMIVELQEKTEEFRKVYEQENSHSTVTVERVGAPSPLENGLGFSAGITEGWRDFSDV